LAVISGAVAINYLDRALLGIATPLLQQQLRLSAIELGWLLSTSDGVDTVYEIVGAGAPTNNPIVNAANQDFTP
jgi:hypothetical protein